MKTNNVLLIVQTILMYLMHTPLYIIYIAIKVTNYNPPESLISSMFVTFFVMLALSFPIIIVNGIFALIGLFKNTYNPSKTTMIVKLVLIPWYVMNFIMSAVLIMGFLNPWLFLAAPLMACILIASTYIFMLSTSLPDITYFFHNLFTKRIKPKTAYIVSVIFLFLFCFDIIGGIIYHVNIKKDVPEEHL